MKIQIKRVDKTFPVPTSSSKDSLKVNLVVRKDTIIDSGDTRFVPLNVIVKIPKDYIFIIIPSETVETKDLVFPKGILLLDSSYKNDEELKMLAYNFSKERTVILGGEVVAYGILVKAEKIAVQEKK